MCTERPRKTTEHILWQFAKHNIKQTDFYHALDLLHHYGLATSAADMGHFIANLVGSYMEARQCKLEDVDVSVLVADYIAYEARLQIQEICGFDLMINIGGIRRLTEIELPNESLEQLLDWGLGAHEELLNGEIDFPYPAKQILAENKFHQRLANHLALKQEWLNSLWAEEAGQNNPTPAYF